jgi:hypothetical protein
MAAVSVMVGLPWADDEISTDCSALATGAAGVQAALPPAATRAMIDVIRGADMQ